MNKTDGNFTDETSAYPQRTQEEQVKYSSLLTSLIKGVIYAQKDKKAWESLLAYEVNIRNYFKEIALELIIDKQESYAYLRQIESEDTSQIPNLIVRRRLTASQTLLLLHLRQRLQEHDIEGTESRLILDKSVIYESLIPYFPDTTNETAQERQFNGLINRCIELGFLRKLKGSEVEYEVLNIIKSFIDIKFVNEHLEAIREYKNIEQDNDLTEEENV